MTQALPHFLYPYSSLDSETSTKGYKSQVDFVLP